MTMTKATLILALATLLTACGQPPGSPDDTPTPSSFDGKIVFVTSQTFNGDLQAAFGMSTGILGADSACQSAAADGGFGGTFVAWMSDGYSDAADRITSDGPWYLVDETTLVFDSKQDLQNTPQAPIHSNEYGEDVGIDLVWTGTMDGGTTASNNCQAWTDDTTDGPAFHPVSGRVGSTDEVEGWTSLNTVSCVNELRLYCFEL